MPPITNLSISSDSFTAKSEYCASNIPKVSITEHLFLKPVTEIRFIFQTPNQACHDNQKEQIARYNKGKSNPVIQQQSLQAFAQETDCNPNKNFNSGSQYPTQFPTNANSCPQPTKNQSSGVSENIQVQNPQYTYATHAEQVTQQKNVVLPSEQQNPQLFQQLNNSLFPQNHNQFLNKTALQFSSLPTQSYTQKQTNEEPVSQLCSQPTVLPNNLQIYQSQAALDFPASSMPFDANVPNFVDSQTQSNAKQKQFCHPNSESSNLIVNNSHASASNANFTAKRTLLINLGSKRLSYHAFQTILVESEAILNSRPLTNFADLPDNEMPLTPNHFLISRPFNSLPPGKFDSQIPASFRTWRNLRQMMNHFWKRLVKEYLPTLLRRSKWNENNQSPLKVNGVVCILKDMTPRGIWPLGRVLEVYPERDGQHRVVKVKKAYGTFVRPVSALARVLDD